ncbi:helix-turn-helix transcriptional regulator [Psychromicrobium xiongbiense]|uniref:helix-turn-helix transcriptional regulator n=1 Tax=Psychromicrobium xiongbiense TaxID=3051184 RepID=UPI002552C5E8|nr:LuxR C-terminal-related transcriptional regulator [Psychromicrobium sp. YIM S02556]
MLWTKLLAEIHADLARPDSLGVLLVGPSGTGKTTVLARLRAELTEHSEILQFTPHQAISSLPLAAVSAAIALTGTTSTSFAGGPSFQAALAAVLTRLRELTSSGSQAFLLVDNAHFLDQQSAAVLSQAASISGARLILGQRYGANANALTQLWRDGRLVRREIGPMSPNDSLALLSELLPGQISTTASSYFIQGAAGSPLALQGLVSGGLEEGSLTCEDGLWMVWSPSGRFGRESLEVVREDLSALEPGCRQALELLALAGPLPPVVLLDLCGRDNFDAMELAGLVVLDQSVHRRVRLSYPAHAHAIAQLVSSGHSLSLRESLQTAFDPWTTGTPENRIADAIWALELGAPIPDARLLEAATAANEALHSDLALRLATAVADPDSRAAALAEEAMARFFLHQPQLAIAAAQQALLLACDAETASRAMSTLLSIHLAMPGSLWASGDRIRRYAADYPPGQNTTARTSASPSSGSPDSMQSHALIALLDTVEAASRGDFNTAHQVAAEAWEYRDALPLTLRPVCTRAVCTVWTASGDSRRAVALFQEILSEPAAEGPETSAERLLMFSVALSAFLHGGAGVLAQELLDSASSYEPTLGTQLSGLCQLGLGIINLVKGHPSASLSELGAAVISLQRYDPWGVLPLAQGYRAYALALKGLTESARAQIRDIERSTSSLPDTHLIEAQALAAAARGFLGEREEASARLIQLGADSESARHRSVALTIHALRVRIMDTSGLDAFQQLAESMRCERALRWSLLIPVIQNRDASALEKASLATLRAGDPLLAAELQSMAVRAYQGRGESEEKHRAGHRLAQLVQRLQGLSSPWLQSVDAPGLTRREQEVVKLVISGLSNRQIAEHLSLAVRTVEGHLYRIFAKHGLSSREELADQLGLLLGPGTEQSSSDARSFG